MGFVNKFHIRPVMTCLWSKLQAQGTAEIRRVCPEFYTIYILYIYVYIIPIWGWVKTYYYNILGNKHLLTSYLRLFKGIWLITIIPGHGTSHDQSAWLAPFTRFAGPGPKGLPERRIAAIITTGWWLSHPSEKYESQLGWWHSNIWKNVPNHQPDDGMMNIWWALNGN